MKVSLPTAWFWRKVRQLCEGWRLDLGRYFLIVAVEASRLSFASSSRIRGLPQVRLTAHIRPINSMSSRSFPGRPPRCRDFQRQNILNPARCQPMTVSGWKMIYPARQFGHHPFKTTHNNRSFPCSLGWCACPLSTARSGAGGLNSPGPIPVWDGARKTGSAGAPRQSPTWLISLGTNPAEPTTSFPDEVSATHKRPSCIDLMTRTVGVDKLQASSQKCDLIITIAHEGFTKISFCLFCRPCISATLGPVTWFRALLAWPRPVT
jgi:hypothetical protein